MAKGHVHRSLGQSETPPQVHEPRETGTPKACLTPNEETLSYPVILQEVNKLFRLAAVSGFAILGRRLRLCPGIR